MKTMKKQFVSLLMAGLLLPAFMTACTTTTRIQGPPATRVEVVPVAPSARHVWIPGHYVRRGRNYAWVNGFYRVAPARYSTWQPGQWRQTRRGPVWVEGYWR